MHTPEQKTKDIHLKKKKKQKKARTKHIPMNHVSPPCIFKLVDGVVRIFLGGAQTQNSMILICCSLSTLAATVHHLKRDIDYINQKTMTWPTKKANYLMCAKHQEVY